MKYNLIFNSKPNVYELILSALFNLLTWLFSCFVIVVYFVCVIYTHRQLNNLCALCKHTWYKYVFNHLIFITLCFILV